MSGLPPASSSDCGTGSSESGCGVSSAASADLSWLAPPSSSCGGTGCGVSSDVVTCLASELREFPMLQIMRHASYRSAQGYVRSALPFPYDLFNLFRCIYVFLQSFRCLCPARRACCPPRAAPPMPNFCEEKAQSPKTELCGLRSHHGNRRLRRLHLTILLQPWPALAMP